MGKQPYRTCAISAPGALFFQSPSQAGHYSKEGTIFSKSVTGGALFKRGHYFFNGGTSPSLNAKKKKIKEKSIRTVILKCTCQ